MIEKVERKKIKVKIRGKENKRGKKNVKGKKKRYKENKKPTKKGKEISEDFNNNYKCKL